MQDNLKALASEPSFSGLPDMRLINGYANERPLFPTQYLQPFWRTYAEDAAEGAGAPVDYTAMGLLSAMSVMIGNSLCVSPWQSWKEPAVLWSCIVGNPSAGKTPGLSPALDLVRLAEQHLNANWTETEEAFKQKEATAKMHEKVWEDAVKKALKKGDSPPQKPDEAIIPIAPSKKRLIANDTTVEMLAHLLGANTRGVLCYRDELAGWLESMNQYKGAGGADRAFWLEAYNAKPFTVDRVKYGVNGSIEVPSLYLPVVGGIQPDKIQKILLSSEDDGLAARFLYSWPEALPPVTPTKFPDNEAALKAFQKVMAIEIDIDERGIPQPLKLGLDDAAKTHLEEFRTENQKTENAAAGLYISYIGKNPGRVLRMALILEMLWWCGSDSSDLPQCISEDAIVCAIDMVKNYFNPMASITFANAATPPELCRAITIAKWIMHTKPQGINNREIQRGSFPGIKTAEDVQGALNELHEANWITPDPQNTQTGGRARKDWIVNPALYAI